MYNKSFIVLNKDDCTFCDTGATGYCKIETKGQKTNITTFVRGLKPDIYKSYKVYLVSYEDKFFSLAHIGDIKSKNSSKEVTAVVDTSNVLSTGVDISKFNVVTICIEDKDIIEFPLVGYKSISKDDGWKKKFIEYFDKSKMPSELKDTELMPKPNQIVSENKDINYDVFNCLKGGKLEDISKAFSFLNGIKEVNPFTQAKLKYKWWQIHNLKVFDELFNHSKISSYIFKHPVIKRLIRNSSYCLFGVVTDVKGKVIYISYGFSAKYSITDQMYIGGFANFYPVQEYNKRNGVQGYWVVHIKLSDDSIVMTV